MLACRPAVSPRVPRISDRPIASVPPGAQDQSRGGWQPPRALSWCVPSGRVPRLV